MISIHNYISFAFDETFLDVRIDALLRRVAIDCGTRTPPLAARASALAFDSQARDVRFTGCSKK